MGKDPLPSGGSSGTFTVGIPSSSITSPKRVISVPSATSVFSLATTLDEVLGNPLSKFKFGMFLASRHGTESLAFYTAICSFEKVEDELVRNKAGESLIARFVQPTAKHQVNLPSELAESLMSLRNFEQDSFQRAKQQMYDLMKLNFLSPFLLANLPKSSATAASSSRGGANNNHNTSSMRLPKMSNSSISSDEAAEEGISSSTKPSLASMKSPAHSASASGVLKTFSFAGLAGGRNRSNSKSSDDVLSSSPPHPSPVISPVIGRMSRKVAAGVSNRPASPNNTESSTRSSTPSTPHQMSSMDLRKDGFSPLSPQRKPAAAAGGEEEAGGSWQHQPTPRSRSASQIFSSGGTSSSSAVGSEVASSPPSSASPAKSLVARLREGVSLGVARKSSSFSVGGTGVAKGSRTSSSRGIVRSSSRGEDETAVETLAAEVEKSQSSSSGEKSGREHDEVDEEDDVGEEETVEEFKLDAAE